MVTAGLVVMKSIDFYRSVHRDFTESTTCGALTSVVATVILATLFVLEIKSFINVPVVTEVVMDSAPDGSELQINFDMMMPVRFRLPVADRPQFVLFFVVVVGGGVLVVVVVVAAAVVCCFGSLSKEWRAHVFQPIDLLPSLAGRPGGWLAGWPAGRPAVWRN